MKEPDVFFVAITLEDGSLAVMQYVHREYNTDGSLRRERPVTRGAVQDTIDRTALPLPVKSWRYIEREDLPQDPDRRYRDAWTDDGTSITHDMDKAREIHRKLLREARAPLLDALDVAYMRADEAGDAVEKQSVVLDKQRLRDVTAHPDIDAAQTVAELRAIWPL